MTNYFNVCYTQNPVCSDSNQSIPLVKAWESQNIDGHVEIKGPSFYMLNNHMSILLYNLFILWKI